jgi:hypothetical protein
MRIGVVVFFAAIGLLLASSALGHDCLFAPALNYGVGSKAYSVFAVDLDGDGDNDLAVANEYSNNVSILLYRTVYTGIDHESAKLPRQYQLSQNYPNPFNAQTIIQYSLPSQSLVTIDIFDILGRKVETLVNGIMPMGEHQATWGANGHASGIYFYRIKAGDYTERRKMMLVK